METINNMALAASRAVWGPGETATKEEPISGVQGDTAKGEPYDAGNMGKFNPVRLYLSGLLHSLTWLR